MDVLAGSKLDEAKAGTLGETVAKLPGVQSSNFGPGVGRPIIRGLDGARVQVLSDGLGSGDVSTVSVDHAVTIEPFLANQIEVLKGPATLLYGSGAIGGAVNVVDGRIPDALPDAPLEGRAELRGGSVNDERTGMFRLDGHAGRFAFHFDALHREAGDYSIPGFAESAAHLAEEGETPDPDEAGTLRQQRRAHRQRRAGRVVDRRPRLHRRVVQPLQHRLRHPRRACACARRPRPRRRATTATTPRTRTATKPTSTS